jgi:hypothetical protein
MPESLKIGNEILIARLPVCSNYGDWDRPRTELLSP